MRSPPAFQVAAPSFLSAQTASFSRKIFELCRTSTGKSGWKRNVVMPRVWSNGRRSQLCSRSRGRVHV